MTNICRITDDPISNPWEDIEEPTQETLPLESISLYDLMGSDFSVWLDKDRHLGIIFELEDDIGRQFSLENVHEYAVESLAGFCRKFLHCYERISKGEAA